MRTTESVLIDGWQRRRRHSDEFKAQAVAECARPGVSIAAIALHHGMNANLLRRWLVPACGVQLQPLADALRQRAIRRACGGRESASLYHRAKYLQLAVLGLGGVAVLIWPGPVQWELCVALGALLTGGLARVQWAYYKQHM